MKRAGAIAIALAACGHPAAPLPKPVPVPVPVPVVTTPPPAVVLPMVACTPPPAPVGHFLSVSGRYAIGDRPRAEAVCDRLAVTTSGSGLRLFDPASGRFTASLGMELFEALPNGSLVTWNDTRLTAPGCNVPRLGRGRVFAAGSFVFEEAGAGCQPACAIIARDAMSGTEKWRRACPCDEERKKGFRAPELYESVALVDSRLVAVRGERGIEAWDPIDGHTLWDRPERARVVGSLVVADRDPQVVVIDPKTGVDRAVVHGELARVEAMAADGDVLFLATSDATEFGGQVGVVISGIDIPTKKPVFRAALSAVERKYASTPPEMWVAPNGDIHFHDPDNGLLTAFDRKGAPLSTLGVAGTAVVRTDTGFALVDDEEGILTVVSLATVEKPPRSPVAVEGVFRLDGKPMPNVPLVVGNVPTKTRADGRFSAKLEARGRFWVKIHQPTSRTSTAYWASAEAIIDVDGRSEPYRVTIDAQRDTME